MKEQYTGIGICNCQACRLERRSRGTLYKKHLKRRINKFRRQQLKKEEVLKHNRFGGYWA